jgi:hypothetical protein
MALSACDVCKRHYRAAEKRCPFCAAPSVAKSALTIATAAVIGVTLSACYGGPRHGYMPPASTDAMPAPSVEPAGPPPPPIGPPPPPAAPSAPAKP